jgi:hypothetical protein
MTTVHICSMDVHSNYPLEYSHPALWFTTKLWNRKWNSPSPSLIRLNFSFQMTDKSLLKTQELSSNSTYSTTKTQRINLIVLKITFTKVHASHCTTRIISWQQCLSLPVHCFIHFVQLSDVLSIRTKDDGVCTLLPHTKVQNVWSFTSKKQYI